MTTSLMKFTGHTNLNVSQGELCEINQTVVSRPVCRTRTTNEFLSLEAKCKLKNKSELNVFICGLKYILT